MNSWIARAVVGINLFSLASPALSQTQTPSPKAAAGKGRDGFLVASALPAAPQNAASLGRLFDKSGFHPAADVRAPEEEAEDRALLKIDRPKTELRKNRYPLVIPPPRATRAWVRTFRILRKNTELTDRYDELILQEAGTYGLDPRLMKSIMAAESEFNALAKSPAGAMGLMQVMPKTARYMGVQGDLTDPATNIKAGAAYLAELFRQAWKAYKLKGLSYRDAPLWIVQRIIAAYHAGPRFLRRDDWFRSTRRYVRKVTLFYRDQVTDIRRVPEDSGQPRYQLQRSSSGFFH